MTSLFSFCRLFFYLSFINEGANVSSESYVYVCTSLELPGVERVVFLLLFSAALESTLSRDKKRGAVHSW